MFEVDQAYPLDTYKIWTMVGTLAFLVLLVYAMCRHMNARNLCFYMATCTFVAFNFGFHVHEKAMLMTIVPLMLDCTRESSVWARVRLVLLKTVCVWTLLPLLIQPKETMVKHMILLVDLLLTMKVFLKVNVSELRSAWQRYLLIGTFSLIGGIQLWQVFYIQALKHMNENWMHRY